MRPFEAQTYLTADELDEQAKARETLANSMQDGAAKQSILAEVRVRSYANMKRVLAAPERKAK